MYVIVKYSDIATKRDGFSQKHFHVHLISYILWRGLVGIFKRGKDGQVSRVPVYKLPILFPSGLLIVFPAYSYGSFLVMDIMGFAKYEMQTGNGHFVL